VNRIRAYRLAVTGAAAALVIAGCGSSSNGTNASAGKPHRSLATPMVDKLPKPQKFTPHPHAKVDQLIVKDLVKGDGPAIAAGDTAIVNFVGYNYATGDLLGSAWGKKTKAPIDKGKVVDGWWQGVPGMHVGGRRVLIVPPALLVDPSGTSIPIHPAPGYFVIDLLGIERAKPSGGA
jgi:peptidylprolyl isomerase